MPRVSAAHEQDVRDRILAAATKVFSEKGYHSSTIQDVVRESGLSVGAIYTYFSGKEELIRLSCDQIATRGLEQLAERLAPATSTAERLGIAIRLYVETIDDYEGAPGQVTLLQAWAEADREPAVREMLAGRRERLVGAGRVLIAQGMASGELPGWLDVDAVTRGFLAMLDGLLLQRVESGSSFRPADLERRATAMLELLLAAGPSRPQTAAATRPLSALPEAAATA